MQTYKNYIDGKWIYSQTGKFFLSLNPATEQPIGKFQDSDERDVEAAVLAAEKSFPLWRDTPAPKRAEVLFKIRDLLKKEKDSFMEYIYSPSQLEESKYNWEEIQIKGLSGKNFNKIRII